jgi:penicillin-binding protein 1A
VQSETTVKTTLDRRMQRIAERSIRSAGLRQAQAALVAMHPDGRVVALVGGRDYGKSPFNRATQARRQPGSTFKLFVYLAAIRAGMTTSSTVDDSPVEIAGWKPKNDDGRYLGEISLARAFARSSNVAAARLTQEVGVKNVIKAARDLGISTPIANEATIGLGTSEVSLLELTAAYAGIANGRYPVSPRGVDTKDDKNWYEQLTGGTREIPAQQREQMLSLLNSSIRGTGKEAVLSIKSYGKTGTSQDSRDAWFIGFAGDLVVGVWVGNDDNSPNPGLHGGTIPARIWRSFMQDALNIAPIVVETPDEEVTIDGNTVDGMGGMFGNEIGDIVPQALDRATEQLDQMGLEVRRAPDGSITVGPRGGSQGGPRGDRRNRDPSGREDRRSPPDEEDGGEDQGGF